MSQQNPHTVLQTENLSVGYRDKKNLHEIQTNINLNIEKGQLVAILGQNGIGKSTLLRTITKVQEPLKGRILIEKKNLQDYNFKEL